MIRFIFWFIFFTNFILASETTIWVTSIEGLSKYQKTELISYFKEKNNKIEIGKNENGYFLIIGTYSKQELKMYLQLFSKKYNIVYEGYYIEN